MKYKCLFVVCIAATLCFAQAALTQSGRRGAPSATPSPGPNVSTTATSEPVARPTSIIITGKTAIDEGHYHSRDVDIAASEIIDMFKLFRLPCKPVKGSTMTKQQAIERARQETDAYVLWLQINVKSAPPLSMEGVYLDRVDYILFRPRTGEVVHQGQIDPNNITEINEHGTPIPPMTKGRSRSVTVQLRSCARDIVRIVRGWL